MKQNKKASGQFWVNNSQLLIPLIAILLLVIFNLFRDPSFFSVGITTNNNGDPVLQGNLIAILNGASATARRKTACRTVRSRKRSMKSSTSARRRSSLSSA